MRHGASPLARRQAAADVASLLALRWGAAAVLSAVAVVLIFVAAGGEGYPACSFAPVVVAGSAG